MSDDWQVVEWALKGYQEPMALEALARLREREAQLERRWHPLLNNDWPSTPQFRQATKTIEYEMHRAEAAEARVKELEAEIERLESDRDQLITDLGGTL